MDKQILDKTLKALADNRFSVRYFPTAQEATKALYEEISVQESVGFGGSWTLMQLKIEEHFSARGNTVYCHHKPGLSAEEKMEIRRKQLTCDVFLTSTNALTESGELVNVDGTGQRVAAMIFGPKKVIVMTGVNKIVKDVAAARERIRNIAAPLNNKRLNMPNPCVKTGHCMNCQLPTRICNATTIIEKRPSCSDIHVWVVGEELGY